MNNDKTKTIGQEHDHDHNVLLYFIMYVVGLVIFITTYLLVKIPDESILPRALEITLYYVAIILAGWHVVGEGLIDTVQSSIKHKRFKPNVHILMTIGAIGALIIQEYNEAVILILIFAGAHFLEDYAEGRSTKAIENLLNLNVSHARLILPDGSTKEVSASELKIGDQVLVLQGDEIPSDGIIIDGTSEINEAAITGESVPKLKEVGDQVFGSTINGDNTLKVEINRNSDETVLAKIIKLVSETKNDLSKTAVLIQRIEPIYVTIVLILAPLFFLLGYYGFSWTANQAFYRTMVFLIGTSPCALAVTDIPATLSAISNLAKNGVLFKGGSFLSNLALIDTIAFDKTGTLTTGKPTVTDTFFFTDDKALHNDIIIGMEKNSNHPIADAILKELKPNNTFELEVLNFTGVGMTTIYDGHKYLLGKPKSHANINDEVNTLVHNLESEGKTVVLLSNENAVLALIALLDTATSSAINAVNYFNNEGVNTLMITGDAEKTANKIAADIGIKTVHAGILPEDKANIIKDLRETDHVVAMLGDGINDAPALALSNIGIAMGDGTDIAIDVADGVIMDNDLNKMAYTHHVSKRLRRVVIQNIFFSMAVVLFLVISNLFNNSNGEALLTMNIAVIFHEGSTLIVILSGLRMLIPTPIKPKKTK